LQLTQLLHLQGRDGTMLSQYTPLDSMLTVVDAVTALAELQSEDLLATRGLAAQEGDERAIASLMVQQIECADTCAFPSRVLVLNHAC
jgi:G3E family GTPase